MAGRALLPVITAFALLSCSVKEDRSACPCLLAVNLSGPGPIEYRIEDSIGDVLHEGTVPRDTMVYHEVPRDRVRIIAVSGAELGDGVRIPYGEQSPPLYLYDAWIRTDFETLRADAVLHKSYCNLRLELDGPPGNGKPVEVKVRGQVCGLSPDGRPKYGEFCCPVTGMSCLLPRQSPSDLLLLDIVMQDKVVRTFSLGTYIREAGYDWTDTDLKDITICLSMSVTQITLKLGDWSHTENINVEI